MLFAIVVLALLRPALQLQNLVHSKHAAFHARMVGGAFGTRFTLGMFDAPFARKGIFVVGESGHQKINFPITGCFFRVDGPTTDLLIMLSQASHRVVGRTIVGKMRITRIPVAQDITVPFFFYDFVLHYRVQYDVMFNCEKLN